MHYGKKMNIMQANPKIGSMDAVLDKLYGKVGSPEREEFRKEAYSYCVGQIISNARKQEKMTQSELAEKVGRLLQGDVGSGKTLVAAAAIWACIRAGYQAALLAPTEILASQHAENLNRLLSPFGMRVALLTGGMKAAARRTTRQP